VGADTEQVLKQLAGLSKEDVARLEAQQVIYCDHSRQEG
jgi:hypothetical protein